MSVFNSFTGSSQNASSSNISEYYATVGEYVKSTLPQCASSHQNQDKVCVIPNNREYSLPQTSFNLNTQCRYNHMPKCVPNYHVQDSRQIIQNTPILYNVPVLHQNNCNAAMMNRHFYHTNKPSLKVNMKKKRKRTNFTTEQIIALEAVFQKKPYINREERVTMMKKLQVSEKSIKIWFQNRRRLTDKKDKDYVSDSPSSDESSDTTSDRLTYIESQIQKNTDKYGYVTLDDKVISELCNIIHGHLSQDLSTNRTPLYNPKTTVVHDGVTKNIEMYEPISPVSISELLDDF